MPSPTSRTCNDRYKRKVDICLTFCGSAINDGCKKIGHTHTHTKKEQKIELKAAAKRKLDVSPLPRFFSYYYVENGRRKKKQKNTRRTKELQKPLQERPKTTTPIMRTYPSHREALLFNIGSMRDSTFLVFFCFYGGLC